MFFRHVLHITKAEEAEEDSRRRPSVSVYPLFFLKMAADSIFAAGEADFRKERACDVRLNRSDESCDVGGNRTDAQDSPSPLATSSYALYELLVTTFVPVALVLFLGAWSDLRGKRHALLMLSLGGMTASAFLSLLVNAFPRWPEEILFLGPLISSFSGGTAVFEMTSYTITALNSASATRTRSLGRLTNLRVLGTLSGSLVALGIRMIPSASSVWVFTASVGLYVLCLSYTALVLKGEDQEEEEEEEGRSSQGGARGICDVLHPKRVQETLLVLQRQRRFGGQPVLLVLVFVWSLATFSRPPEVESWVTGALGWDALTYFTWSKSTMIVGQVVTIAILITLRWRPIEDSLLVSVSEALTIPENLVLLAVARPGDAWVLGLVSAFSLMHNFTEIGITSAASKEIEDPEFGRLFALLAATSLLSNLLQKVSYHALSNTSFEWTRFLVAASVAVVTSALATSLFCRRKGRRAEEPEGGVVEEKMGWDGVEHYF